MSKPFAIHDPASNVGFDAIAIMIKTLLLLDPAPGIYELWLEVLGRIRQGNLEGSIAIIKV